MTDTRRPISFPEARGKIIERPGKVAVESVPLTEALGRVLAEEVRAPHDMPPFHRSPYDGFALRAEDTAKAERKKPVMLRLLGFARRGTEKPWEIAQGEAVRIATGAALPAGADTVVMQEHAVENGDSIKIFRPLTKGENVSQKGEEVKQGERLLEPGRAVNPGIQALLASFGISRVAVFCRPRVALLALDPDLLDVDESAVSGAMRNSNIPMLVGQVIRAGGVPKVYRFPKTGEPAMQTVIQKAFTECDTVVTTGGASVGKEDVLPRLLRKLDAEILFNKVKMRPGSITTAAEFRKKIWFGLSGNPSACYVGFEVFARPHIQKIAGRRPYLLTEGKAQLVTDYDKKSPVDRFVRVHLFWEDGRLCVRPSGLDKSNAIAALTDTNGLMVVRGGTKAVRKGERVQVLFLDD